MVQLDHDEESGPVRGVYGTMDAELAVQRTINEAELPAFLCLLKKVIGSHQGALSTIKESLTGYGEDKVNASTQKVKVLICGLKFGKNCTA